MKSPTRRKSVFAVLLGFAATSCGQASIAKGPTEVIAEAPEDPAETFRARGEAGLQEALRRYDAAAAGAAKDSLALLVDRVAGQRYATTSRLFWHTDLDSAKTASVQRGLPILSLRMLGRLDEDLSCANSRLFRVVLYANRDVSKFLRESFVLHWSSERQVPRVTVDYGDGRVIETTIAGNSAHYVLDSNGRPLDVLPGLYGPQAFMSALRGSAELSRMVSGLEPEARVAALRQYHLLRTMMVVPFVGSLDLNPSQEAVPIDFAEMRTVGKAFIERPVVGALELGGAPLVARARQIDLTERLASRVSEPAVLDADSRALLRDLRPTDWKRNPEPLSGEAFEVLVVAFQKRIDADTALNDLGLRLQIHERLANGETTFEDLNRWIYTVLFLTPAVDPWLGLATPGIVTGLPNDGHQRQQAASISSI